MIVINAIFATENSRRNFRKIRGQNRCFAQKSKSYYPNRLSARRSIAGRADAAFDVLAIVVAHHFNYELKSQKSVGFGSFSMKIDETVPEQPDRAHIERAP